MISPTLENTSCISRLQAKAVDFIHSKTVSRIISVALITLAIVATVGSCVAMTLTLNLWFLLLSAVGGVALSLGIMSIFILNVKPQPERIS
ncbi:hypothetical protein [Chlamydia psittaci]|uniref:hypothetical protein n=1 Tax=Chlamydia psittaci TaxID=83554 RepID=UPI003A521D3B